MFVCDNNVMLQSVSSNAKIFKIQASQILQPTCICEAHKNQIKFDQKISHVKTNIKVKKRAGGKLCSY